MKIICLIIESPIKVQKDLFFSKIPLHFHQVKIPKAEWDSLTIDELPNTKLSHCSTLASRHPNTTIFVYDSDQKLCQMAQNNNGLVKVWDPVFNNGDAKEVYFTKNHWVPGEILGCQLGKD